MQRMQNIDPKGRKTRIKCREIIVDTIQYYKGMTIATVNKNWHTGENKWHEEQRENPDKQIKEQELINGVKERKKREKTNPVR